MTAVADVKVEEMPQAPSPSVSVTRGETSVNGVTARGGSEMVPQSPIELLSKAMDMRLPPEELAKFMDLYRQMEADRARMEFFAAFAKFQAECPPIKKSATAKIKTRSGSDFGYTFAPLDEIARTVNPHLTKNGMSYSWDTTITGQQLTKVCTLRHVAGHFITSTCTLPIDSSAGMSDQQKVIAAGTFAERKSLSAVLGLTTTDQDSDGAGTEDGDPTTVSEDQITELTDIIADKRINISRFLTFMKVDKVSQIRAVDYKQALTALSQMPAMKEQAS